MVNKEQTLVHALVPATESDTSKAVVTWRGTLPSESHNYHQETYEETLNRVAVSNFGRTFLSVASRSYDLEQTDSSSLHIVYTTKLSAQDIELQPSQRIDTPRVKQQNALVAAARHLYVRGKEGIINGYYDATIYGNYLPRH